MSVNQSSQNQNTPIAPAKVSHRSHGIKLIVICFLVLLMAIPAMFISYIAFDRSNRADDVVRTVSNNYGGPQILTGPMLSVPYVGYDEDQKIDRRGDYIIFADQGVARFEDVKTETRKLSLFRVPIFMAEGTLSATFRDPQAVEIDPGYDLDWSRAQLLIALSDVRGLKQDIDLTLNGQKLTRRFEPASAGNLPRPTAQYDYAKTVHSFGVNDMGGTHHYLTVPIDDLIATGGSLKIDVKLKLGGAKTLGVRPFARSTQVSLSSTWNDPGFVGDLPPDTREITENGFSAEWNVPDLRRGIRSHGSTQVLSDLMNERNMMGVNFVATSNPYQTVNRALKYSVLFIGLVFLAYFLLEVIVGIPVHPAQYLLIGLAQSIFYLLLLAFSEHIGFVGAFLISATATISATAGYAGAVFGNRTYIFRTGLVFSLVYGLLFVLMRLQDFALMIGALTSFVAIAGTMFLTRNMNWYGEKS